VSTERVTTLSELFARSARGGPDRPAVRDGRSGLTYEQLDRASDAVAAMLADHGVTSEDRVLLQLERSVELLVAVLGVVKAGGAYVAVDTRYPKARRDLLRTRSGARIVLVGDESEFVSGDPEVTVLPVSAAVPATRCAVPADPRAAANVIFTSGSSGEPKGIVLEHRNLVSLATNTGLPAIHREDRMGQISSASFDAFNMEIWTAFAAGAEIIVLPPVPDMLATGFRAELDRYGVTAMVAPTMVVNHVARAQPDAFAPLRVLQAGGDVLLPSACRTLLDSGFRGALYNLYGPAETTTCCTGHRVTTEDADGETVPIGLPIDGVSARVLDAGLRPVAPGETGELFIGGPGVARGYLDRPDLTAERFVELGGERLYRTGDQVRQRPDGALLFVGRLDDQLRIRGYRVEPSEVENALRRHDGVHDAVVIAEGEGNDRSLVTFLETADGVTPDDVRAQAVRDLPDYMVPARFVPVPRLPVSAHGKRDLHALRAVLAEQVERESSFCAPATDTERYLAGLWQEMLGVETIGRTDDFFGLGGHSLLAFRMHHQVNRDLDVQLAFPIVLDNTVLTDLALAVDDLRAEAGQG
jgi:amino acid adenylation domain-containing protein